MTTTKDILKITLSLIFLQTPIFSEEIHSEKHRNEIEALIENYILENPETIVRALDRFRENMRAEKAKSTKKVIAENIDNLTSYNAPSIGNPKGDIVVIEFVDYNCGYCKRVLPGLRNVAKKNKDVRIIFKEVPILGPSSLFAAQWALAAHKQGKYFEYHSELMNARGQINNNFVEKIAAKLGLNPEQMKKDAASDDTEKQIAADLALADKIGISGTPAFIVDQKLFRGYRGEDDLNEIIADARRKRSN